MLQENKYQHSLKVFFAYFLLSYIILYFVYKYFVPEIVCIDFFSYYPLYKNFDIKSTITPFNTRLLNPLIVFIFNKAGIYYNTNIAFKNPNIDQSIFFSALLISYLSVVFTSLVIYLTCNNHFKNKLFSFGVGLFYLLGGGTLVFCINPATDAFSILLLALIFKSYLEKSKWIYPLLFLAIFQREYIFIVMSLVAVLDIWFERKDINRYLSILFVSILCFCIYMGLRKTVFYTPNHEEQLQYNQYLSRLFSPEMNLAEYIRQGVFTQNILISYFLILIYKCVKKHSIAKKNMWIVLILILQINLICLIALLGNNIGRLFYMTTPIVLFYLAIEVYPLYNKYNSSAK